jgi:hypothetical protein
MQEWISFIILRHQKYKNRSPYFSWTPHYQVLWIAVRQLWSCLMRAEERFLKVYVKVQFQALFTKLRNKALYGHHVALSVTRWQNTNDELFVKTARVSWKLAQKHWYFTCGRKGVTATLSHNSLLVSVKLEIGYLLIMWK